MRMNNRFISANSDYEMTRLMNLRTELKQKLNKTKAFTIAETLVAIIILLMVSSIVAAGMPAAISAYKKVEIASDAELLMSTTISTLRNELGVSSNVEVDPGKTEITYYNGSGKMTSRISNSDNKIMLKRSAGSEMSYESDDSETRLISDQLSTNSDLDITYESVEINDDLVTFKKLKVYRSGNVSNVMTSRDTVMIRIIS